MMKLRRRVCAFALLLTATSLSYAACDYPRKTAVPDGSTASEEEMAEGQQAVRKYVADIEVYLDCVVKEAEDATVEGEDPEITQQRMALSYKRHDAAVEEMETVAAEFNEQVRVYKGKEE